MTHTPTDSGQGVSSASSTVAATLVASLNAEERMAVHELLAEGKQLATRLRGESPQELARRAIQLAEKTMRRSEASREAIGEERP